MDFFIVFAGGGLGAVLRYVAATAINAAAAGLTHGGPASRAQGVPAFPFGTLIVNLLGCAAIGALWATAERMGWKQSWRLFLFTGILGGFTTFSSFGLETVSLMRHGRIVEAAAYVALSAAGGLLLCAAFMKPAG